MKLKMGFKLMDRAFRTGSSMHSVSVKLSIDIKGKKARSS